MIFGNGFDGVVGANKDVRRDRGVVTRFGGSEDNRPIVLGAAVEMLVPQLETGIGDTRRFFPNVGQCCVGPSRFGVGGVSKGLLDGSETSLFCKQSHDLTK